MEAGVGVPSLLLPPVKRHTILFPWRSLLEDSKTELGGESDNNIKMSSLPSKLTRTKKQEGLNLSEKMGH